VCLGPSRRDLAEANQLLSSQEQLACVSDFPHPIEHWLNDLLDEVVVSHNAQAQSLRWQTTAVCRIASRPGQHPLRTSPTALCIFGVAKMISA
jgi:hypothetical protein